MSLTILYDRHDLSSALRMTRSVRLRRTLDLPLEIDLQDTLGNIPSTMFRKKDVDRRDRGHDQKKLATA
jgi:hypothetical protein